MSEIKGEYNHHRMDPITRKWVDEKWEPEECEPSQNFTPMDRLVWGLIVDQLNVAAKKIENELENCQAESKMIYTQRNGEKVVYECMSELYRVMTRITRMMSETRRES